jgi:hypothetical protein
MPKAKLTRLERSRLQVGDYAPGDGKKAVEIIDAQTAELKDQSSLLKDLLSHLDYCGWGDRWERECSEPLRKRADEWLKANGGGK